MGTLPAKAAVEIISSVNKNQGIVPAQTLEKAMQEARIAVSDHENYKLEDFKQKIQALETILPEISKVREECFHLFEETIVYSNKVMINNYDKTIDYLIKHPEMKPEKKIKHIERLQKNETNRTVKNYMCIAGLILSTGLSIAVIKNPRILEKYIKSNEKIFREAIKTLREIIK